MEIENTQLRIYPNLRKNAQTYCNYGDNVSAEIVESILKIAHELDKLTEGRAVMSISHDKCRERKMSNPLKQGGLSTAKEILPLLPFGRTTLWRKCKNGQFPEPQRLNPSVTVWQNDEVNAWLANPTKWRA